VFRPSQVLKARVNGQDPSQELPGADDAG
jgi:hypothetical protein